MSHVFKYGGHYFRIEVAEVADAESPGKVTYVGWSSDAFRDLKDLPRHSPSRLVAGPPLSTHADALGHALDWIKSEWDAQHAQSQYSAERNLSVLYTTWLFKGDSSFGCDFENYSDAKAFAAIAEKSLSLTKVGVKNNESPQYLTVWEKG